MHKEEAEERVTSGARVPGGNLCVPKFRMKPVSSASAAVVQNIKQLAVCVISWRLASHLSVVSAVMVAST